MEHRAGRICRSEAVIGTIKPGGRTSPDTALQSLKGQHYPPTPRTSNPAEGVWANLKNGLGNLAACDVDQLAAVVRNRLKRIQYRPALIGGFLAQTGLSLEPEPP
jgi:hypothetical protein